MSLTDHAEMCRVEQNSSCPDPHFTIFIELVEVDVPYIGKNPFATLLKDLGVVICALVGRRAGDYVCVNCRRFRVFMS